MTWSRRLPILLVLGTLVVPSAGAAADLEGTLRVTDPRGKDVTASAGAGIVWFQPDAESPAPEAGEFEIVTSRKRFEPRVLVVPKGSTVAFPNQDPILHNVFSVSGGNSFDLGLLPEGPGGAYRFGESGVVRVFCNVHHDMVAYVVVLDTPFHAPVRGDGSFHLTGLPPGPGTLTVWHERGDPVEQRVDPGELGRITLTMEATRPLVPPHLNKLGKPYSRRERY